MQYKLLNQRDIIDVLIGDRILSSNGEYKVQMPYLSGSDLCTLSTRFGLPVSYSSGALSRWVYMQNLLNYAICVNRCSDLLNNLFSKQNFRSIASLGAPDKVVRAYNYIIKSVIDYINGILSLSQHELIILNGQIVLKSIGPNVMLESLPIKHINVSYIHSLKERCAIDLNNGNYDSVITKARTLIEEIFIYILDEQGVTVESKGDVLKLFNQIKNVFNMQQSKDFDGRINSLLSGLERIIQAVAEIRNMNSDSHGVGKKRITIKKHEAQLVINSAITFSEYMLAKHEFKTKHLKDIQ